MMNTEPSKHSRKRFVVATIAMVLLTALSVTRTSNAPASAHSIPDLDLKSEDGALSLFGEGSVRFDKQLAEFRNASSLSYYQIDGLRAKANDVKTQLSQATQAIKSAITKLKATNRWERLDDEVQDGTSNTVIINTLKGLGGARRNLEDTSQINSLKFAEEIDGQVEALRAKSHPNLEDLVFAPPFDRSQMVRVAYHPDPFADKSLRCRLATARYTISKLTHGGHATAAASSNVLLSCPDPTL